MVGFCRRKLVNVVAVVTQGSVLGPLLFLLYNWELFQAAADDSTVIAVVPSQGVKVTVAESLSHDLVKVSERCDL